MRGTWFPVVQARLEVWGKAQAEAGEAAATNQRVAGHGGDGCLLQRDDQCVPRVGVRHHRGATLPVTSTYIIYMHCGTHLDIRVKGPSPETV